MKTYFYRILCGLLTLVMTMSFIILPVSAEITITDDTTTVYVQNMDAHSEGVVPAIGMAIRAGQWFEYTVNSPVEADFRFILHFSYRTTWTMKITLNDEVVFNGGFSDQSDGTSETFYSELCILHLKEGINKIKLERISHDYHISYFVLQSVESIYGDKERTEGEFRASYLPCIIEAENFDYGAEGSYVNIPSENTSSYRNTLVPILANGNGYAITLDKHDYTKYTFYCEYSGVYSLKASTNSYGNAEIYIDDKLTDVFVALGTSDYEETDVCNIYIPKGKHILTVKSEDRKLNFDYFRFESIRTEDYVNIDDIKIKEDAEQTDKVESTRNVYMSVYVSRDGNDNNDGTQNKPFATIERALVEVKKNRENMTGDIVINILPGIYEISKTIKIDEQLSGKNGNYVVLRGVGEDKPIISGGIEVDGWEKVDDYVYKAAVPEAEDVREFYVNSYVAQRARSKYAYALDENYIKDGSENASDGFYVSKKNFPKEFKHPEELELSWTNEWCNQRTPVDAISSEDDRFLLHMRQPAWNIAFTKPYATTRAGIGTFYIENAIELLDEPGEFYFDKTEKLLYYYPYNDVNMDKAECYVGAVEMLIDIEGTSKDIKAGFVSIENLDFRHGTWLYQNKYGMVHGQAGAYYDLVNNGPDLVYPGQLQVDYAEFVNFTDCNFINLGSAAISTTEAASNINIEGNLFRDIMGGAIEIDSPGHGVALQDETMRVKNVSIRNNVIIRAAQGIFGLCGVAVYYADTVNIEHNELYDLPYTGVTIGWGWGADVPNMKNLTVVSNVIKNTQYLMHDGAPIYTLGPIRGGLVKGNYISGSPRAHASIYHDNGSRFIETSENVVEDSGMYSRYLYINDNASTLNIHDNYATETSYTNKGGSSSIEDAVKLISGNYPEKAKEIIVKAGVEDEYAHLKEDIALPEYRKNIEAVKSPFESEETTTIWAADYIKGGNGVAYYDTTDGNAGNKYRQDDVDIWSSSTLPKRYDVGIDPNEWINYDVKIQETATYDIAVWASNSRSNKDPMPAFNLYCDGELIVKNQPIKYTGATNKYDYTMVPNINLTAGKHRIRIEGLNDFFGVTYLRFDKANAGYFASDYDEGMYEEEKEKIVFTDMEDHWAKDTVYEAAEDELIYGIGNNMFAPDSDITLSQTVMLLLRLGNLYDTDITWQQNAIERGLTDTEFLNDSIISRGQFINLLIKRYYLENGSYHMEYNLNRFTDLKETEKDYIVPILGASELGIVVGDPDGLIRAGATLTRAEAAVMLLKLRDVL